MAESFGAVVDFSPTSQMLTPEYNVECILPDDDNADDGIQQPAAQRIDGGASTVDMEMMESDDQRETGTRLEPNGDVAHPGHPHHAVVGDSAAVRMDSVVMPQQLEKAAPGEVNSLAAANAGGLRHQDPCTNLYTATEKEIMDHLRHRAYNPESTPGLPPLPELNADLARRDPWDLNRRVYFTKALKWGSSIEIKTVQGYWKPEGEVRAVYDFKLTCTSKRYIGLERILQFHMNDGTKTDWFMSEHFPLSCHDGEMFLEDHDWTIRHVYQKALAGAGLFFSRPSSNVNVGHNMGDTEQSNQAPMGKRVRTDDKAKVVITDVWQHFTRIYIKVPPKETSGANKEKYRKKAIYAVCHNCDKVFGADSPSHHRRHAESCLCKSSHSHSHSQPSSSGLQTQPRDHTITVAA